MKKGLIEKASNPYFFNDIEIIFSELEMYEDANDMFNQATKLDQNFAKAYLNWGVNLRAFGDIRSAIQKLETSTNIRNDYLKAHLILGVLLTENHEYSKACKKFDDANEIKPSYWGFYNWGYALEHMNEYKLASDKYEQAAKIKQTSEA